MLSKSADLLPEACRSLFLGDLSCFCQEIDIYRVFSQFGGIEEIRIKRNNDGNGLGYGFVTFLEMKAAENALAVDGLVILGRPVKISWANVRCGGNTRMSMNLFQVAKPKTKVITADSVESAQLHFSFISKHQVQLVTEETIRNIFVHFGHVQDVTIKKTSTNPKTGEQTGYGFVHFSLTDAGIYSAISAAKVIHQVYISKVLYDCRLTWSLEEIIRRKQLGNTKSFNQSTRIAEFSKFPCREVYSTSSPTTSSPPVLSCFHAETTSSCHSVHVSYAKPVKSRCFEELSDFPLASASSFSYSSQTLGLSNDSDSLISTNRNLQPHNSFSHSFSFDEARDDMFTPASLSSVKFSSSFPSVMNGRVPSSGPRCLPSQPNSPFQLF